MTQAQFLAWRKFMRLTQREAAAELGISTRRLSYLESGDRPIPRYVALACAAMAIGIHDYADIASSLT